jgi:AraC family transcriptional regulator of adaptative response / DNA-3-methyladenine glycosylase II
MESTSVMLRLPTRAPFDGVGLMRFFADHAIEGLETGDETTFERSVRMPGGRAKVHIVLDGESGILCEAQLDNASDIDSLTARVRRMFDLDADSAAIDDALRRDAVLAPLVDALPGIRIPGSLDPEETLIRTLIGQQISVAAARTVLGRLTADLGTDGMFPTPSQIAERGHEALRGPATRIASIIGVAEALSTGALVLDAAMPVDVFKRDEFMGSLTALRGVGPWTAGYLAMRALGDTDILLTSDLIIMQSAIALGLPATPRALATHAQSWSPWRSYAGMHLWRARPGKAGVAPG